MRRRTQVFAFLVILASFVVPVTLANVSDQDLANYLNIDVCMLNGESKITLIACRCMLGQINLNFIVFRSRVCKLEGNQNPQILLISYGSLN